VGGFAEELHGRGTEPPQDAVVERLWNGFGDNLTANRRSFKDNTLATVVFAKMNYHIFAPMAM
jgi:hypothetical protein